MADPARNAAIWYAADGYDPVNKPLNGRRVAGESFLRGFFQHADVDEFQAIVKGTGGAKEFTALAKPYAKDRPIRPLAQHNEGSTLAASTVHYPAPNFAGEAWRRYHLGQTAFSISGITHTTATTGVMQGMFDLRTAPVEPWDGVICTSRSVFEQVSYQFDLFDAYAAKRFGTAKLTRPQLTTIPLGIHTKDFRTTKKQGATLRKDLGIGKSDLVFMVLSRLSASGKFDPLPVYRALANAREVTQKKLHLILCGYFDSDLSEKVFRTGAAKLMPEIALHVVDGKAADARLGALSAADVFLFPIDNVQETFGLAPIEAMAAGLPVIVSDWDGMKDTITPDVGIRVPTYLPGPAEMRQESVRYQLEVDNYHQYMLLTASMTVIDVPKLTEAMVRLIENPDLRKTMGQAGQKRAQQLYDWAHVIPQMQDFWADLTARRLAARDGAATLYRGMDTPTAPNAARLFQSYPTEQDSIFETPLEAQPDATAQRLSDLVVTRAFKTYNRELERLENLNRILNAYRNVGRPMKPSEVAAIGKFSKAYVTRTVHFLLKYDFLRVSTQPH